MLDKRAHSVTAMKSREERLDDSFIAYEAFDLFVRIANKRKYSLQLSPKKYVDSLEVSYQAIALPHGANQKPIKGEGETPEDAIFDLWDKLGG